MKRGIQFIVFDVILGSNFVIYKFSLILISNYWSIYYNIKIVLNIDAKMFKKIRKIFCDFHSERKALAKTFHHHFTEPITETI